MRKIRVLFYVQHLLGVGHVKRAAAIARALRQRGIDVHVAFGGEKVKLAHFGDARVHQLPSARAADLSFKVLLDEAGQPIDEVWRARRKQALLDLHDRMAPDAILVEHFPFGRRKFDFELLPLFDQARGRGEAILCSVRDVLVEKGEGEQARKIAELARRCFDRILVHGDPALIPFGETFKEAPSLSDRIVYTGYVVDEPRMTAVDREAGRDEIIVSVGGGAVGMTLLETALAAALQGALQPHPWRLLGGDNLPSGTLERLQSQAGGRVIVEAARPDFRALLSRSALSISQAGYNTLMDILTAGCPAVVVPFVGAGESEQTFRARAFARHGVLHIVEESTLAPATLIAAAQRALAQGRRKTPAIDLGGAARTAQLVTELVAQRMIASAQ